MAWKGEGRREKGEGRRGGRSKLATALAVKGEKPGGKSGQLGTLKREMNQS